MKNFSQFKCMIVSIIFCAILFYVVGMNAGKERAEKMVLGAMLEQQLTNGSLQYKSNIPDGSDRCLEIKTETDGVQFLVANSRFIQMKFCSVEDPYSIIERPDEEKSLSITDSIDVP